MTLDPMVIAALFMFVAWTMIFAGLKKHQLEAKHRARRCPSCGRRIAGRVCDAH